MLSKVHVIQEGQKKRKKNLLKLVSNSFKIVSNFVAVSEYLNFNYLSTKDTSKMSLNFSIVSIHQRTDVEIDIPGWNDNFSGSRADS